MDIEDFDDDDDFGQNDFMGSNPKLRPLLEKLNWRQRRSELSEVVETADEGDNSEVREARTKLKDERVSNIEHS